MGQHTAVAPAQTVTVGDFTFAVPALDIDRQLGAPQASGKVERRIVAALIAHLERAGFFPSHVWDGEELTLVTDAKSAMEVIFNLDEASLRVRPRGADSPADLVPDPRDNHFAPAEHGILLVLGNGIDVISDWNFYGDDRDGFNAVMNAFDAEVFA